MWSASSPCGLQVVGVEGGVASGREDQGALRVDDNLLPLLRVRLPPGGVGKVGHHGAVRRRSRSIRKVFVALLHHLVQMSGLVHGVEEEGLVSPLATRLVSTVVILQRPASTRFERVARDVVAIAENFLPVLWVLCHVAGVEGSVASKRRDSGRNRA